MTQEAVLVISPSLSSNALRVVTLGESAELTRNRYLFCFVSWMNGWRVHAAVLTLIPIDVTGFPPDTSVHVQFANKIK